MEASALSNLPSTTNPSTHLHASATGSSSESDNSDKSNLSVKRKRSKGKGLLKKKRPMEKSNLLGRALGGPTRDLASESDSQEF